VTSKRDILNGQPRISHVDPKTFEIKDPRTGKWVKVLDAARYIPQPEPQATAWERITHYGTIGLTIARVTPYLVQLIYGVLVKNWKTTISAVVGAIAMILNALGVIELSTEFQMAIVTVVLTLIGFFSADAKKEE